MKVIRSSLLCVLDTNILLHGLEKIVAFRDKLEEFQLEDSDWMIQIVIPHVVLQELDALKNVTFL